MRATSLETRMQKHCDEARDGDSYLYLACIGRRSKLEVAVEEAHGQEENNGQALQPRSVHGRRRLSSGLFDEKRLSKAGDSGKDDGYG